MKELKKEKNQNTVQIPEKKDYQSPVCEQHKPLEHVRYWQDKSSELPGIL